MLVRFVYWILFLIVVLTVMMLTGCVAYTAASTATYVVTDKTIADHAATAVVPNGDCGVNNVVRGQYYCEVRDISATYNRNTF